MGIHKALRIVFKEPQRAYAWVKAPNTAFGGRSALEVMLRGPLGRALGLRHAPELRFVNDELIESGAKLSALISKAVKEDEKRHVDDPDSDNTDSDDGR